MNKREKIQRWVPRFAAYALNKLPPRSPQKRMLVMGHLFPRRQIAGVPAWLGRPVGFLDIKVEMVVVHPRCYQIAVILSSSEVLLIGTSVKFGD